MSGSGISWAICKSAPRSRQITTPATHHSVFTGRMPFLPPNQQRQSTGPVTIGFYICVSKIIEWFWPVIHIFSYSVLPWPCHVKLEGEGRWSEFTVTLGKSSNKETFFLLWQSQDENLFCFLLLLFIHDYTFTLVAELILVAFCAIIVFVTV